MQAAVLGGAGFLGRHLCQRLLAAGHAVTVYGRTIPPPGDCPSFIEGTSRLRNIVGNIQDAQRLNVALAGVDWVFHLAGDSLPHQSNLEPHQHLIDELGGLITILEACIKADVSRLLLASSGGTVYGDSTSPLLGEDHPTNPICSYGIGKLAAEKYLQLYQRIHDLPCVILRVANCYGEGQRFRLGQGVIPAWMSHIRRGEPVVVYGDGEQVRDYVYVKDVADAFLAAAEAGPLQECVFNIGSGVGTSLNQLHSRLEQLTGKCLPIQYRSSRCCDVPRAVLDVRRAREQLGWETQTPLNAGLERTWAWLRQRVEAGLSSRAAA